MQGASETKDPVAPAPPGGPSPEDTTSQRTRRPQLLASCCVPPSRPPSSVLFAKPLGKKYRAQISEEEETFGGRENPQAMGQLTCPRGADLQGMSKAQSLTEQRTLHAHSPRARRGRGKRAQWTALSVEGQEPAADTRSLSPTATPMSNPKQQ